MDKDRAQAFARDALAWMAQRNIPPTPANFELVYAYVGMENSDLKRTMDGLVGNGCKFDANVMTILHARFFQAGKENDAMAELGAKITAELDAVLKLIHVAGRDQSAFGSTLSKATGELNDAHSADGKIKALIDHVIHATRAMEARSKTLELQLQTSSTEVAKLRERLESVRRESLTDTLTGIPNRKASTTSSTQALSGAARRRAVVAAYVRHRSLQGVQRHLGPSNRDQVLRLVANCLSER
jgi:diguanylate cyclase